MYCICCKQNKVKPFDPDPDNDLTEEDMLWEKTPSINPNGSTYDRTISNAMVSNGIIQIIEAGFGSKYDGDRIIISICDDCIKENLEDATLLYYDNYMFNGE